MRNYLNKLITAFLILIAVYFSLQNVGAKVTSRNGVENLTDVINITGNIQQNLKKVKIKKEIDKTKANSLKLKRENEKMTKKIKNLQGKIKNTNKSITVINKGKKDKMLKWTFIPFFFFLGAFVSSLVFVHVIWRVKIKGR